MSTLTTTRLDPLRQIRGVWLGGETAAVPAVASGHLALDRYLPGLGWPRGSLIEILPAAPGIGELSLLLPALRRLAGEKRIAFVQPPFVPYAPALANSGLPLDRIAWIKAEGAEAQWATEQSLRSGAVSAALYWGASHDATELRRLQLAAEAGNALLFLFRPLSAIDQPTTAAVRMSLYPQNGKLRVDLLKARGGRPGVVLVDPFRRPTSSAASSEPPRQYATPVRRAALT